MILVTTYDLEPNSLKKKKKISKTNSVFVSTVYLTPQFKASQLSW